MKIKKDDKVVIIAGSQGSSKGGKQTTGKVLKVFPKEQKVIVEGVNLRKRHTKPTQRNPQGGIIEKEMPIAISNVMLVDSKGQPTRVGAKIIIDEKTGKKKIARVSKKSGEMF